MYSIKIVMIIFLTSALFLLTATSGQTAWYDSDIVYQQAITKILKRGDINWGANTDDYYNYSSVLVSANGNKLLFTGKCGYCYLGNPVEPNEVRPYLVNTDGTGLVDLYDMLPSDITSRWSAWRNLLINDDASKIFFRAFIETGYYDDQYLYVFDVASSIRSLAVDQKFGGLGSDWFFRINESGSRVYLDKYDAGWDETLEKNRRGLFFADTGAPKQWYMDVDELSCDSYCGNLNMLYVLGTSPVNNRTFMMWNSDYDRTDGNYHTGLWYTDTSSVYPSSYPLPSPVMLTDEHYLIQRGDTRGISNSDGSKVIYTYRHLPNEPAKLAVVDVAAKSEKVVGWASSLNPIYSHMSRSGRYILARGPFGDTGTYYQTMIDLQTETSRDTWSYYLFSQWGNTSNITKDDRFYYYAYDNNADNSGIYRVDMRSTGDPQAPYIQNIGFDAPAMLDHDGVTLSARVTLTDPQGLNNIDWVRLVPLVEGQEEPPWAMGREPLAFPSGDSGSTLLYDDATHGDEIAGDGVYTFDSIATRKGDREGEHAFNTWYQHYSLPSPVGVRIITKDTDNNYSIADTQLVISKLHASPETLEIKVGTMETVLITGASPPYTVVSNTPELATAILTDTVVSVVGNKVGKCLLTVTDSSGNSTTVSVQVTGGAAWLPAMNVLILENND